LYSSTYVGDEMKNNEMEVTFGAYGAKEMCVHGFDGETRWKETTWKIILKWIFEKSDWGTWSGMLWLK